MFVETIDLRCVPDSIKMSRDPADHPSSSDLRHIYECDKCGIWLYSDQDRIYIMNDGDRYTDHLCEHCFDEIKKDPEFSTGWIFDELTEYGE